MKKAKKQKDIGK